MGWNLLSSIPESQARCGQVTLPIEEATSTPLYLDTSGVSLLESGPLLHTGCHLKSFVLLDSLSQAGSVRGAEQNLPKGVFHQSFCHSSGRVVLIHAPLPISTQPECKNSLMRIYSQRLETRNSLFVCGLVLPTAGRSLLVPNPSMDLGHQDSNSKNQKRSECYIISFESLLGSAIWPRIIYYSLPLSSSNTKQRVVRSQTAPQVPKWEQNYTRSFYYDLSSTLRSNFFLNTQFEELSAFEV